MLVRVAAIELILYLILSQVFLIAQAQGNSMFPAVKDGDLMIGYRLEREYSKGDVVIYEVDGERRVGRVAALESDVITFSESGTIMVNGTAQTQEVVYPTYEKDGLEYPYTVPEGCMFILGDYRTQSEDSRDFGAIPVKNVKSKVITVLRRRMI